MTDALFFPCKYSASVMHSYQVCQSFNAACKHMGQGMHPHDAIFEYPILDSVYLEPENIYVQCPAMREFAKRDAVIHAAHH